VKPLEKMKAVVCPKYGPPEVLQIREVPKPTPKPHEVLVRVRATTVTTSDCYVRGFQVSPLFWLPMALAIGFPKPRQPILGMAFAGEVVSRGTMVSGFTVGDRVYGMDRFHFGAYAELMCVSTDAIVSRIPGHLGFEEASALPYGGLLALFYLKSVPLEGQKNVLICGAYGAVGSAAVQIAKALGATVTGVCSQANVDLVRGLGADFAVDYTQEGYLDGLGGWDLVFDAVPSGAGSRKAFRVLCAPKLGPDGRYTSVQGGHPVFHREHLLALNDLVEGGQLRPVIDRVYGMDQMVQAHRHVESWHKKGNVVVQI